MERRDFLGRFVQVSGVAIGATVAVPGIVGLFGPVFDDRGPVWKPLDRLDAFAVGQVRQAVVSIDRNDREAALQERGVYVWRPTEAALVIFSRSCTDLGCPVTHDPGSGSYYCPCHGGIFDEHGRRRAGPPNRPLFRYAWRVVGGVVEIDVRSVPPVA